MSADSEKPIALDLAKLEAIIDDTVFGAESVDKSR